MDIPNEGAPQRIGGQLWPWAVALLVCLVVLVLTRYNSRDPDSQFYVLIVEQLATKPWRDWIAPTWMGFFQFKHTDFIKDHFVGHFIPALLLARAGFPAQQALYAMNLLYQILCLGLIGSLARAHFGKRLTAPLLLCLLFSPIAFLYRVRANHEPLVLLGVLVGMYAALRMRRDARWTLLFAAACHLSFLAKGIVFVMVPACAGIVLLVHGRELGARRVAFLAILMAVALASVGLSAMAYETAFYARTGESFFEGYWKLQIVQRSMGERPMPAIMRGLAQMGYVFEGELPFPLRKLANMLYYAGTVLWSAMPWTLALLAPFSPRVRSAWRTALAERPAAFLGVLVFLLPALFHVFLFSASNRLALRYIYPAHWLAAAAGASLFLATRKEDSRIAAWMRSVDARPALVPLLFAVLTCATLLTTGAK